MNAPLPHPMRRATDVLLQQSRLERIWNAIKTPGRRRRLAAWRRAPHVTTKGYLAFRDFVVMGLCVAVVFAGTAAVRNLRREDCEAANARRAEVERVALQLLGNDRRLIEIVDRISERELPPELTNLLLDYEDQRLGVLEAYAPSSCPEHGRVFPWAVTSNAYDP